MTTPIASRPIPDATAPCPCGSGETFGQCCQPLLAQTRVAKTADELMRSRFTAHKLGDYRHLHLTDLETAQRPYLEEKMADGQELAWTRLVIHAHDLGPKPDTAFVDFSAYFQAGESEQALHEKSEFVRRDGVWYYTRAVRTGPVPVKAPPKVGRNDPCPCGSGKKYKQCCGR